MVGGGLNVETATKRGTLGDLPVGIQQGTLVEVLRLFSVGGAVVDPWRFRGSVSKSDL
jgi:hypothetical protein